MSKAARARVTAVAVNPTKGGPVVTISALLDGEPIEVVLDQGWTRGLAEELGPTKDAEDLPLGDSWNPN